MRTLPFLKSILLLFLSAFSWHVSGASVIGRDTVTVNPILTNEYHSGRKNPAQTLSIARKALSDSKQKNDTKGIADASLALGTAYLAKYNPGDSATFYLLKALDIYNQLNDIEGQARACYGLSYLYNFKGNPQKSEEFGTLSIKYFKKAGDEQGTISALEAVVYLAKQAGDYEKALDLSKEAIALARSIRDTLLWADALNNKGNVLKDMLLLNPAIDAYFEAFNLWRLTDNAAGLAVAYGSVANAYFFEGDYRKSLEYNFKKLPITQNAGNEWETSKAMNNIAMAYSNLGQHDSALFYMRESLELAKKLNYPEGLANCYHKMASAFLKTGNRDSALFYSSEAVSIAERINSPNLPKYELNRATALEREKRYSIALTIAKKAYTGAKLKNDNHTLRDASFLLNDIYYRLGQSDRAYPFLMEYIKLDDSISNMEYMRKVTRLDIQHQYEEKQKAAAFEIERSKQQIEILNKTNQIKSQRIKIFWILIMVIVLLSLAGAVISFLVISNQNHRIEQMKLQIRNYLLNPELKEKAGSNEDPLGLLIEKYGLTRREAEIMELISTGIGNEEIAGKLFVSKNTVKFHIKNIFIKLNVKNRVQAMHKSAL